ncbi:hypothetical protein imdm_857 [gamma proteobacterium IMCC2047]|nr:hypothetical protein imdm_857 [gamma proteobacterium IMCC2047]
MLWHKRQDNDAGLKWLRYHLKRISVLRWNRNAKEVCQHLCK